MTFADRVKYIKKQKGITNEELSRKCGIPLGTLSKLLCGFTEEPKLSSVVAIASALDCPIDFLALGRVDDRLTLSDSEETLIKKTRKFDTHAHEVLEFIVNKEYDRCARAKSAEASEPLTLRGKAVRAAVPAPDFSKGKTRKIPFYSLPVSAGTGVYLDNADSSVISIVSNVKSDKADFALRVYGNSMMPDYSDGDILLVENKNHVNVGELGIFICDGEGYFKKFGGDRLISLNDEYDDIMLDGFSDVTCRGLVLGHLKQRR